MRSQVAHTSCLVLFTMVLFLGHVRLTLSQQADGTVASEIGFNKQVRPILARHCIACHGPDEEHREAGLRLDIREDALAAIEPGDSDSSELMARVTSSDKDVQMPPPEHGSSLNQDEIETLRQWIQQGAKFEQHWSFVKPVSKQLPERAFADWGRNEIDRWVASKLKQLALKPSADGDPHRLIRRLSLDLTGLPPSPEMVQRYAKQPTDEVYEQIVDELLASPSYGERWAAMWLDIARYADTKGYAEDRTRDIWPWRDWVIRAFNDNLGYDQFTIQQIAGDLLPEATERQRLATAFHRNTLNNTEGGTNNEEFRMIAVKDRISTTMNVWMGLTLRCAECHTHKYDPITHEEYYQFLDFFNQTADADLNDDRPRMLVYPEERKAGYAKLDFQIAALEKRIEKEPQVWFPLEPSKTTSRDGTEFKVLDDQSILPVGKNPRFDEYAFEFQLPAGKHTGLRLEMIPDPATGGNVGRGYGGGFVINQIRAAKSINGQDQPVAFSNAFADYNQRGFSIDSVIKDKPHVRGWAVKHPVEEFRFRRTVALAFKEVLELKEPTTLKVFLLHASPWPGFNSGRTRFSSTEFAGDVADAFRKKSIDPLRWEAARLRKQRLTPVQVPIMQELPESRRRSTYINLRGNYMARGKKVSARVPQAFHELPADSPRNRLGVAEWIVSEENPLTARVAVNRFWARLFGVGLVETEEDFGTQGSVPSNQDLLDWLALDFQKNQWDVKRLLKKMVMSSTYRQDNRATQQQLEIDPQNRFLARGPRFRLSAEVVRDQALSVSGLLSARQFGPPVYPPSPVKRIVNAFTGGMTWEVSKGEDRNRRAIYTFLKRSSPHPLFDTFDMASRTVCNMRRIRTNTPLQSFMTLNDETFLDCARALAGSMHRSGEEPQTQISTGLQQALLHPAKPDHVAALTQLYQQTLQDYQKDPLSAEKLVGKKTTDAPQLAALTVVANVIMNLDEFLTR